MSYNKINQILYTILTINLKKIYHIYLLSNLYSKLNLFLITIAFYKVGFATNPFILKKLIVINCKIKNYFVLCNHVMQLSKAGNSEPLEL